MTNEDEAVKGPVEPITISIQRDRFASVFSRREEQLKDKICSEVLSSDGMTSEILLAKGELVGLSWAQDQLHKETQRLD